MESRRISSIREPAVACLLYGIVACASASVASAQRPARTVPSVKRDTVDSATLVTPVVVTVLRAPLALSRAPFAVATTTSGDAQRARMGLGLDEALRGVPGVQVDNRYNFALGERISVRGFGARSQFGVRGVRVLVDGIPATLPDGQTNLNWVDLGSLSRAEVMRGPASALYGNASGGVIQLETEAPAPVAHAERIKVTGGENGLLRGQFVISGTAAPATYLASTSVMRFKGYRDWNDASSQAVNSRVTWSGVSDELKLVANAFNYSAKNPGGLTDAELRANPRQAVANNVARKTGKDGTQGQLGTGWKHSLGSADLDVTAHFLGSSIVNPIATAIIDLDRIAGGARVAVSGQVTAASRATVGWGTGFELETQRDSRLNFANDSGRRGALSLDQKERVTSLSPFAESWAVVGNWLTLLAGARYDQHLFSVVDHFISGTNPDDSGDRSMGSVSPSLGASLRVLPGVWVYGNFASAFDTPTTTELANRPTGAGGFNPALEPQRTRSVEGGVNLGGGSVRGQLTAYRAHVVNALIPFEVPSAPGRQYYRNAGSAFHRGGEASIATVLSRHADAKVAYSYTSARFEHYTVGTATYDGNRVPGVAPHRVDGTITLHAARGGYLALDGRYSSSTPVDDANAFASPAFATFDLRAGGQRIRAGRSTLEPFVGLTNLLDRSYNTSVVVNAAARRYFEPGPRRMLYGGLELRLQ